MLQVGVRELKSRLSLYLKRVARGERITVTSRGRPVATLGPAVAERDTSRLHAMLASGSARWGGGKPRGSSRPAKLRSKPSMAETVLEDRR